MAIADNHSLEESEAKLLLEVFDKVPSAIIILDEKGVIVKANASALNLLGEEKLVGCSWLSIVSKVFCPRQDDGHEISTRDDRRLQVSAIDIENGQIIQMNDLTETRMLQDKLSHMERLSSLGRMAASLAHQIRTPLSAAILYAANLANNNLQPMARKRFQEKLMSRLEALEAQVSDILMFARSNEQTVSQIDAGDLVEQTVNNVTAILKRTNAELETSADAEPMPILGNANALTGALSNLIVNAVEAGASKVLLRLEQVDNYVEFTVANNGPVIPDDLKQKIFEPFFTSKSSGTGLGLAVVSAVTKVHHGSLFLDKYSDEFPTAFTITIPLYQKDNLVSNNSATLNSIEQNKAPNLNEAPSDLINMKGMSVKSALESSHSLEHGSSPIIASKQEVIEQNRQVAPSFANRSNLIGASSSNSGMVSSSATMPQSGPNLKESRVLGQTNGTNAVNGLERTFTGSFNQATEGKYASSFVHNYSYNGLNNGTGTQGSDDLEPTVNGVHNSQNLGEPRAKVRPNYETMSINQALPTDSLNKINKSTNTLNQQTTRAKVGDNVDNSALSNQNPAPVQNQTENKENSADNSGIISYSALNLDESRNKPKTAVGEANAVLASVLKSQKH